MARLKRSLFQEQPRAFYMIFLLEIWERFGYYTAQGILTLYFVRYIGFDEDQAYHTFGAFSALVYGMVAIGGYLGDKVLGTKRVIVLGLVVLGIGYLSLACASPAYVFLALGFICVGNGLFKANPSSLLAKCYEDNDPRLHGAFTLYYMAINLGSIFALFIGPTFSHDFGYGYAFFMSFVGILLGLANYVFQRQLIKDIQTIADARKIHGWQWVCIILAICLAIIACAYLLQQVVLAKNLVLLITAVIIAIYFLYMAKESKGSKMRMLLALILMVEAVIFFTLYQQMPTSLNLFAVNNVVPNLFGISIDPQSFQALNPIWIVSLSPLLAWVYRALQGEGYEVLIPYKFALGMSFCGLSFMILFFARFIHDEHGMVSFWWLVFSYLFQSLGELLVSALGVAMVAELVPRQISGFVMGMWFLTSSLAGFLGASVASYTALPKHLKPGIESLMIYTQVFAYIGAVTLGVALFLWIISPRLSKLMG